MKKRFEWIDNIRGVMIFLVAMGHIITDGSIDNTFNSIMRMPTFFMISGFLFKFKPAKSYFKHKTIHLIIPYFVYLIPILGIQMYIEGKGIIDYLGRLLLGGAFLYTWTGVFWFITCLFFTQQIFNLFINWPIKRIAVVMLSFLLFAYLNSVFFPSIIFPLSINICLYSCPLFFMGFLFKRIIEETNISILIPIIILVSVFILSTFFLPELYINMKNIDYGIPIVSYALSVICAFCTILLFRSFNNFHLLSFFGKASMVIMYLHLPIKYTLEGIYPNLNQWMILLIAVLIPTLLYYQFKKHPMTKRYLLGE
ncbi:acyltransferase family protein [Zobellia galactanivorans]|uniref:acyltransferase family protein n=1 Tax=Zobellia galactanivorans (strain DSM 12802 / CCUG 47099 / CIP 106680 / NCIMB 13871 / Dsij) TaxID=63186 RepID=UPI001C07C2AB|nr:acyltransferase family protein [Zobellia galactanivorans]